ncbi:hypothetical protein D3C71_1877370 [compost metagenome]
MKTVFVHQQLIRALGDIKLVHRFDRLSVLINGADDNSPAVFMNKRRNMFELFFTIFKINGVNNRLALAVLQCQINNLRIGSIDHKRNLDLFDDQLQK